MPLMEKKCFTYMKQECFLIPLSICQRILMLIKQSCQKSLNSCLSVVLAREKVPNRWDLALMRPEETLGWGWDKLGMGFEKCTSNMHVCNVYISHTYWSSSLNENILPPAIKGGKKKTNPTLLVFPHDCGTIAASTWSPSPVPGKIPGSLAFA